MTPQEQAEAILKAAEEATPGPVQVFWDVENESVKLNAQPSPALRGFTKTIATGLSEEDAAFFVMARKSAPSIALALLEKLKALEEAEAHIQILLDIFEPIPGSETSLDDKRMIREARAFLSRISTASSTLDAIRDELGEQQ